MYAYIDNILCLNKVYIYFNVLKCIIGKHRKFLVTERGSVLVLLYQKHIILSWLWLKSLWKIVKVPVQLCLNISVCIWTICSARPDSPALLFHGLYSKLGLQSEFSHVYNFQCKFIIAIWSMQMSSKACSIKIRIAGGYWRSGKKWNPRME